MLEIEIIEKKLKRAEQARKQAEKILEDKALELFKLNQELEAKVEQRTKQIAKSETKYRSIIENMELGLLEVNNDGIISKSYPRFCEMIGYTEEELIGKNPVHTFVLPEFWTVLDQQQQLRQKGVSGTYQIQLKKKDGDIIWVLISGAPYYDQDGKQSGTIGVHYDITEQIKLRSDLQKAKILAERAQKAEQNFLANMSHEIRTPLNAVIGMSHLLGDTDLNKDQTDYLDILLSSAKVLQALISDILDISKIDAGKIEIQRKPINLIEIIDSIEKTFQIRLDSKAVVIKTEIDNRIKNLVLGDVLVMNQILFNLMGNAEKFTAEGEINLRAQVIKEDKKEIKIHFEIEDTGIGIDENKINLIFEEFKQADPMITKKFGGSGLGLAITKKLLLLLGSTIKVKSRKDIGTLFEFDINFEKTDVVISDLAPEKDRSFNFENIGLPVLVAEDNQMNQKYISKLLEKWNLKYDIANDGLEALHLTEQKKYSMVFMDIQMPNMNGHQATLKIRALDNENRNIPIIALTASTLLSKKQEALDAGMSDYLSKPFNPAQLAEIISKFMKIDVQKTTEQTKKLFNKGLLDRQYLNDMYGDDLEYAKDIFETFLEITDEEIEKLKDACENSNFEIVYQTAHKIKPTFQMVGLPEISKLMEKIEMAGKDGDPASIKIFHDEFSDGLEYNLGLVKAELEDINKKL